MVKARSISNYGKASAIHGGDKCPELFSEKYYLLGGMSTKEQIEAATAQGIGNYFNPACPPPTYRAERKKWKV